MWNPFYRKREEGLEALCIVLDATRKRPTQSDLNLDLYWPFERIESSSGIRVLPKPKNVMYKSQVL